MWLHSFAKEKMSKKRCILVQKLTVPIKFGAMLESIEFAGDVRVI